MITLSLQLHESASRLLAVGRWLLFYTAGTWSWHQLSLPAGGVGVISPHVAGGRERRNGRGGTRGKARTGGAGPSLFRYCKLAILMAHYACTHTELWWIQETMCAPRHNHPQQATQFKIRKPRSSRATETADEWTDIWNPAVRAHTQPA